MKVEQYKDLVAELGCLVCGKPAELHHPRLCIGMSQRQSDWLVIPLCEQHHRTNGFGHAIHNGQHTFELNYMTEQELLAVTIRRITNVIGT